MQEIKFYNNQKYKQEVACVLGITLYSSYLSGEIWNMNQ